MSWIPGITTRDISELWRNEKYYPNNIMGKQLQDRTGYQMENYRSADIVTLQTIALARVKQPNTISQLGDVTNQPRYQLGDVIAGNIKK